MTDSFNIVVPIQIDELDALRRDALRYRWLREHSCQSDSAGNDAESWSTHSDPTSLDREIDSELAKQAAPDDAADYPAQDAAAANVIRKV